MKHLYLILIVFLGFNHPGFSQGLETFDNLELTGNAYTDGSFLGQDGSSWQFIQARGDIAMNGKALTLARDKTPSAEVVSGQLSGGIGILQFSYMQPFSNNVNLEVYVNDDLVYTAITDDEPEIVKSTDPIDVEIEGDFTLRFSNPDGAQVTLDDITWTAYSDEGVSVYCVPEGTNSEYYIDGFKTNGGGVNINKQNSGFSPGGYGNFYGSNGVSHIPGGTVHFEANLAMLSGFRIWVDWNQDGVFGTDEVAYFSPSVLKDHFGSIQVPGDALTGVTRMRIVSHRNSPTAMVDPCQTEFGNGEFEDYKFTVVATEDCDGIPNGGMASSPSTGNPGTTYTVFAEEYAFENELSFQWESNTDGAGWEIESNPSEVYADFVATAPEELGAEVEWRLAVTCNLTGDMGYSETTLFVTALTYCEPFYLTGCEMDYIDDFILTGANGTEIHDVGTGCSENDYRDRSDLIVDLYQDVIYTAQISSGSGLQNAAIWIDFDLSGTFELSELVGTAMDIGNNETTPIDINISSDAPLGEHRMRIMIQWNKDPWTFDPCVPAAFWGEVHDYTVNILTMPECSGSPDPGTVSVDPETGNPASVYQVSSNGYTIALGMSYQWQSNTNAAGWVNVEDPTNEYIGIYAIAPGSFSTEVEWRLVATCSNSGESVESDAATFTTHSPGECSQEFEGEPWAGTALMSPYEYGTANDFIVPSSSSFKIESITLRVINITSGEPTNFELRFYEDGSPESGGSVGEQIGDAIHFESPPYTFTGLNYYDIYPMYDVVLSLDDYAQVFVNDSPNETKHYWIYLTADASDTGENTYWVAYVHDSNSNTYPTWQTENDGEAWFEFQDENTGNKAEGIMWVEGSCDILVGVEEMAQPDFAYYPNPVGNVLHINSESMKIRSGRVFNILGQQMMTIGAMERGRGQIDVTSLGEGVYLFEMTFENNQTETFKIFKE